MPASFHLSSLGVEAATSETVSRGQVLAAVQSSRRHTPYALIAYLWVMRVETTTQQPDEP